MEFHGLEFYVQDIILNLLLLFAITSSSMWVGVSTAAHKSSISTDCASSRSVQ